MSINDLLNDDSFIPIMMVLFVVIMIFAIPAGLAMSKKANSDIYGNDAPTEPIQTKKAKILARRTAPHPLNQAVMVNTVVFELPGGIRIELAIKDQGTFGVMVEGDQGTLQYQGKKFISFTRSDENEE